MGSSVVGRSLDVGFRVGETETIDDGLQLVFTGSDSHGENVSDS